MEHAQVVTKRHGLSGRDPLPPTPPAEHRVQFYDDESFLYGFVGEFLHAGLSAGQSLIVIATEAHQKGFCGELAARGVNADEAVRSGQLRLLDAEATLATFMVDGMPDWTKFRGAIGPVLELSAARNPQVPVRAYGEMVDILSKAGNSEAALQLEEYWNELGRLHRFVLLCAYWMGGFANEIQRAQFEKVCHVHTQVTPAEGFVGQDDPQALARQVSLLQQRARALETELVRRRELEEALRARQQELADFFENAVEGLHWVDSDGVVVWANPAELQLLGYTRDEYVGHHIAEFHADRDTIDDMLARLLRRETLKDYEARMRCKNGTIKSVLVSSNALFRQGQFVHTRCFTRDITDRKRLDEELRRKNEELSRIVRFSETFVGVLGHDLRNPLSAVATAADLLLRRYSDEGIAKPVRRIVVSAERMSRMIDQLLDFTRIRLGQGLPLQRSSTNLANVCRATIDEFDKSSVHVQFDAVGDLVGSWDRDRLAQLMSNLVANAMAHGRRDSPVVVRLDGHESDEVAVTIANAGAIPADLLPVIFEPLKTSSGTKAEGSSGLGLGLYISHEIVQAHSGSIAVVSSSASGTEFTIRLPRHPPNGSTAFAHLAG